MDTPTDFNLSDDVSRVLGVLAQVAQGNLSERLDADLPPEHPLAVLYRGVNETVESLARARADNERIRADLEAKLATIDAQRDAIRELTTPVIEIWDGVLCLPVVGLVDTARSSEMTDTLLTAVVQADARCAIVDITGIEIMDTGTADYFIRMAKAVRLLGAECVLTGISPGIAQTIVAMGVDMSDVVTERSLRTALQNYVARAQPGPGDPW